MGMNRQMKRMMQRQGQLSEDGSPAVQTRERRQPRPNTPRPGQRDQVGLFRRMFNFIREVRAELRKVAWPSRNEVANLSVVVLATLVILIGLIFVLDLAFAKAVLYLFKT
ncbi:MAG: preprotein translocase subunit SecE [Actinomycetota bacterium]|nr:preprotein translocase subunit SecE [Actinomycetota bacterium]